MTIHHDFNKNFTNGQQLAMLRHIAMGEKVTPQMVKTFFTREYQRNNPKTVAVLKELFDAIRNNISIDGKLIAQMSQAEKQKTLAEKIKQGYQIAALALMGNGARLDSESVATLQNRQFQAQHPKTYNALRPFLPYCQAPAPEPAVPVPAAAAPIPQRNAGSPPAIEDSLVNLRSYLAGDGGFVNQEPLSHEDIERLKVKHKDNPIMQAAFSLVKGLDIANRNDVLRLSHFIHDHPSSLTANQVIDAIDNEKAKLNTLWQREEGRMSLPTNDSFEQMLKPNGVLFRAKKILREHPEILNGQLPIKLGEFRNKDLAGLKAALAITARMKGADKNLFEKCHGFYKAQVPHGSSYASKLMFADHCYVPASGYILGADQLCANDGDYNQYDPAHKAGITDCSGFMTDILRQARPDLTWLKNHRLQSWGLEPAHDYKFLKRSDVENQEGPIQYSGRRRAHLSRNELSKLNNWVRENPNQFDTIDKAFDTVANRNDIKAGDFIVYRQRKNGHDYSTDTGHVALVADYTPGTNKAILMEYTRSGGRDGVGFTKRPICYGEDGNTVWETRVLRPKRA